MKALTIVYPERFMESYAGHHLPTVHEALTQVNGELYADEAAQVALDWITRHVAGDHGWVHTEESVAFEREARLIIELFDLSPFATNQPALAVTAYNALCALHNGICFNACPNA